MTTFTMLADSAGDAAATGSGIGSLALFGVFFVAMYFLLIRPQRKRQQDQQKLIQTLEVGSDVVTIGGLHGTIEALTDEWVDLEVTADGTVLRFQRNAIARTVTEDAEVDTDTDTDTTLDEDE